MFFFLVCRPLLCLNIPCIFIPSSIRPGKLQFPIDVSKLSSYATSRKAVESCATLSMTGFVAVGLGYLLMVEAPIRSFDRIKPKPQCPVSVFESLFII